jgi:hypothetical protein
VVGLVSTFNAPFDFENIATPNIFCTWL